LKPGCTILCTFLIQDHISATSWVKFEAFTATECNDVFLDDTICENGVVIQHFRGCLFSIITTDMMGGKTSCLFIAIGGSLSSVSLSASEITKQLHSQVVTQLHPDIIHVA
jgi:hypothetical protein